MSNSNRRRMILAIAAQFAAVVCGVWLASQFHRDVTNARNTGIMAVGMIAALGVAANLTMWAESRGRIAKQPVGRRAIISSRTAILEGLARLATTPDTDALARVDRTCRYVAILARRLAERDSNVDADLTCSVALASLLYEVGNVTIDEPAAINPGPVTAAQTQLLQRFDARISDSTKGLGNQIQNDSLVELASTVADSRNARWDGQGSLGQLRAEGIPIASRILALASLYDSLTASQPRKEHNLSHAEAASILIEGTGNQLDPRVVEAFLANHKRFETIAHSPASQQSVADEQDVVALFDGEAAELACQPDSVSG